MFLRKLQALNHPQPQNVNFTDANEFSNLIVWLEDQKIRHYKIEDRAALRNTSDPNWNKAFIKYLGDLDCPYSGNDRLEVLDWLLGYSIRLEYGDDVEKYKVVSPASMKTRTTTAPSGGVSSNPLDNLDFNDPDFKAGVTSLAMLLQIPPYNDHLEQLKAICLLVKERLSKEAMERSKKQASNDHIPLERTDLGFDTGDYIINEAAKILRLLHIRDLRELQSNINHAIVAVQAIIANPKTDSRLGKVGR